MSTHTLGIDEHLHQYLVAHSVDEGPVGLQLREVTAGREDARMQIAPEQGQLLWWLVRAFGVSRAIEVGTFTGYSALRIAEALPSDGVLVCCDVDTTTAAIARRFWQLAGVSSKINLILAPATDTLQTLIEEGTGNTWDMVFIDADKTNYPSYLEFAYTLLRPGGIALIDNVLWSGAVADPSNKEPETVVLRELNARLVSDLRWDRVILPIADGLTMLRKQ